MEAPSEKSQKYDRQLRLWGDHGQALLESCSLCLINATATGCEILKNLILPGVGSFSIMDTRDVTEEDLGNNFFLTPETLGKKRGQAAVQYLQELNDEVSGEFIEESLEHILKRNPEVLLKYNLVIVTTLQSKVLLELSDYLWHHDIPLIVCKSYGMIGYLRLVTQNHAVMESHPEHPIPDLSLLSPFPELVDYCDSINLDTLSIKDHKHVPWLVIVYKFLQNYKSQHNGDPPKVYKDKKVLSALIQKGMRHNKDGVPEDEENFEEAAKSVNTALTEHRIPSNLREILDHPLTNQLNNESKSFWILCRALKDFIEAEGCLPLQGSIPDMTADSQTYIALQQVYRNKATGHVSKVYQRANDIKHSIQVPSEAISMEEARLFCRNAENLSLINCRSLESELNPKSMNAELLASRLDDDGGDGDDTVYYILLRAADEFYTEYTRYPGCYDDQVEADIPLLKTIVTKILHDAGMSINLREDYIHDFCSFGGSELHTIASYMGGVAAQEAIKIITKQYIPIKNTYIYNGATQSSTTLEL